MSKFCPTCGNITATDLPNFCYKDGTMLETSERCACGNELLKCDVYCPQCGLESNNDTKDITTNQ